MTESTRSILRTRAEVLARKVPDEGRQAKDVLSITEFLLSRERYAVEFRFIREILPLKNLTPLPCTPAFVLGIVNLRGQILSVIDLKRFFGLPGGGITELNRMIVLKSGDMEFGILSDEILGIRAVPRCDIRPLSFATAIPAALIVGMTEAGCVILDGEKVLSNPGIRVEEEVP